MQGELSLIDTNVLVYSVLKDSENHQAARRLLESANDADAGLCVCSQVLAEFYAVVTDPRRVSASQSPAQALAAIESIIALPGMTLLPTPVEAFPVGSGWRGARR